MTPLQRTDLIERQSIPRDVFIFLQMCVIAELNIVIGGTQQSGKTTLLNILNDFRLENQPRRIIDDLDDHQAFDVLHSSLPYMLTVNRIGTTAILDHLESLYLQGDVLLPEQKKELASRLDLIITLTHDGDHKRLDTIGEVWGYEEASNEILTKNIIYFEKTTEDTGRFRLDSSSHMRYPRTFIKLDDAGIHRPPSLFRELL